MPTLAEGSQSVRSTSKSAPKHRLSRFFAFLSLGFTIALIITQLWLHSPVAQAKTPEPEAPANLKLPPKKQPVKVTVGLHISNLADINQASETFAVAGYLLYNWNDPRLAYNPKTEKTTSKASKLDEIWHPNRSLRHQRRHRSRRHRHRPRTLLQNPLLRTRTRSLPLRSANTPRRHRIPQNPGKWRSTQSRSRQNFHRQR
jgi:hypothetical protein